MPAWSWAARSSRVRSTRAKIEADSAIVTRPLNLRLEDGDRVQILVDLNSQDWLLNVDPALLLVPEEFFANAIEVRVR